MAMVDSEKVKKLKSVLETITNLIEDIEDVEEEDDTFCDDVDDCDADDCEDCSNKDECEEYKEVLKEEKELEKQKWKRKFEELKMFRSNFVESMVQWVMSLPYLPDGFINYLDENYDKLCDSFENCFEMKVEPTIALKTLDKIRKHEYISLEDIFGIFGFRFADETEYNKKKAVLTEDDKRLLNALKNVEI